MIDLHTHILPGIDDGSPNAGTSMRMLRQMAVQGTQILCASPHYYADEQSIHEFCEKRDVAFAEFRQAGLGEYEDQPIVSRRNWSACALKVRIHCCWRCHSANGMISRSKK